MSDSEKSLFQVVRMNDSHRELCRLYAAPHAKPEEITAYFSGISLDDEHWDSACMVASMCARHDFAGVPSAMLPRIKGILRYYRMLNAGRLAATCRLLRLYNDAGIKVMVIKGAAILMHYEPNHVRHMWDTDILVPATDYRRALALAEAQGFSGDESPHSKNLQRNPLEDIDVHWVFMKGCPHDSHNFWAESETVTRSGAVFQVPEFNLLFIQCLANSFSNFTEIGNLGAKIKWFMDITAFLNHPEKLDWERVIVLSQKLGVAQQVCAILRLYNAIIPGLFNFDAIAPRLSTKRQLDRCFRVMRRCQAANERFENPPDNVSVPELVGIHMRWLWAVNCMHNPHSLLKNLRTFPGHLTIVLHVRSVWQLPAIAQRKIKKQRAMK